MREYYSQLAPSGPSWESSSDVWLENATPCNMHHHLHAIRCPPQPWCLDLRYGSPEESVSFSRFGYITRQECWGLVWNLVEVDLRSKQDRMGEENELFFTTWFESWLFIDCHGLGRVNVCAGDTLEQNLKATRTAKQVVFPCSLACGNRPCYLPTTSQPYTCFGNIHPFSWPTKPKSSLFPSLRQTDWSWRTKFGKMPPYGQKEFGSRFEISI